MIKTEPRITIMATKSFQTRRKISHHCFASLAILKRAVLRTTTMRVFQFKNQINLIYT